MSKQMQTITGGGLVHRCIVYRSRRIYKYKVAYGSKLIPGFLSSSSHSNSPDTMDIIAGYVCKANIFYHLDIRSYHILCGDLPPPHVSRVSCEVTLSVLRMRLKPRWRASSTLESVKNRTRDENILRYRQLLHTY